MPTLIKPRNTNKVVQLNIDEIAPNKNQPRRIFDLRELQVLADSIKQNGMLQPITVRRSEYGYELVAGERRLRASKLAGLTSISCIVLDITEKQSAVFALIENLQRSDLNYFEEAVALKNLITEMGLSQTELGQRIGKAQSTIANKLRLLCFPVEIQSLLIEKGITERQARALLKISDKLKLPEAIEYVASNKLSSVQTERYVDAIEKARTAPKKVFKPIVRDVRVFFNTINNAIKLMNESGINAVAQRLQNDEYIEYIVKIPLSGEQR